MFSARFALTIALTLAAALTLPAAASAWVGGVDPAIHVTTPSADVNANWNYATGTGTSSITVSGNVTAGYSNPSNVKIACYRAPTDPLSASLSPSITVSSVDQSFSTTINAKTLADMTADNSWNDAPKSCQLRAVPVDGIGNVKSFAWADVTGPRLTVSSVKNSAAGNLVAVVSGPDGGFTVGPAGDFGAGASGRVVAPFDSGGYLPLTFNNARTIGGNTMLDGNQAWLSTAVLLSARGATNYVAPSWTYDFSNAAAMVVTSSETLLTCSAGAAIDGSGLLSACTTFAPTGVMLTRTYTVTPGTLSVVDSFSSSTGNHNLSLTYNDLLSFNTSSSDIEYVAPTGGAKFKPQNYPNHTVLSGNALPAVGTFFADRSDKVDGATDTGRAALTYAPAPASAWVLPGAIASFFTDIAVTSAQPAVVRAALSQSQSQATLNALASAAQVALGGTSDLPEVTLPNTGGSGGGGGVAPRAVPSFGAGKAKVARDKKTKLSVIATGRSLVCSVGTGSCTTTAKLTASYKVKKKKKTATFASTTVSAAPGASTPIILKLSKKNDKLFSSLKKLKFTLALTAGSVSDKSTVTLKAPKAAKKK